MKFEKLSVLRFINKSNVYIKQKFYKTLKFKNFCILIFNIVHKFQILFYF